MAVFCPAGIGKLSDYVCYKRGDQPDGYSGNEYFDINSDGKITKGEVTRRLQNNLAEGLRPENRYDGGP
jgi:hypothetical protein